jgi:hypothetical protein
MNMARTMAMLGASSVGPPEFDRRYPREAGDRQSNFKGGLPYG